MALALKNANFTMNGLKSLTWAEAFNITLALPKTECQNHSEVEYSREK